MKEVQRHNFEFIRTEVFDLSIECFADKIGVSKSSYQRMKSENYDSEYYFPPIQKVCELADVSLDVFSTQRLTKELYEKQKGTYKHIKTPSNAFLKRHRKAFLLFAGIIILGCAVWVIVAPTGTQPTSVNSSPEIQAEMMPSPSALPHIPETNKIYYWTDRDGGSYHLNRNCPAIKNRNNIESGTLKEAHQKKKFDPCDFCVSVME